MQGTGFERRESGHQRHRNQLVILNCALVVLGVYLITRSLIRMRPYEQLIHEIKAKHSVIGKFID